MEHDFYVIQSPDWINIIPITPDRKVVMVRQYRHGARAVTMEIPGGLVEPGDTPEGAASRELMEETGYRSEDWIKIGEVNPNPALFGNRCHTYLARNVSRSREPELDPSEDIEVVLVSLDAIPEMIRGGVIDHTIVIAAFSFYFLNAPEGWPNP
jgi:8-oxo-dGTP pyrophosphatase MutT (NUDIX family)